MAKKYTKHDFVIKANIVHNNKYEYVGEYINSRTKIKIKCNNHGYFYQKPNDHLQGNGCPLCSFKNISTDEFIKRSNNIHNNKYDYSLTVYEKSITKVKIICTKHDMLFEQRPSDHLGGSGCPKCAIEISNFKKRDTLANFIIKAETKHGNKYDYSLVNYINSRTDVDILCNVHNIIFKQKPHSHLSGVGCPICKSSKGEYEIFKILNNKSIEFEEQKTFIDCVFKRKLKFDFYLPVYNVCIEFDGRQHFEKIDNWGGEKRLIEQQQKDEIKNKYCSDNNIGIIRIKYDDDIELKMKENNVI